MRIWIAGPRAWENPKPVDSIIRKLAGTYGIGRLILIEGGAPGVDKHVEDIGVSIGVHVIHVKAAWPIGRHAGPMRNRFIAVELQPILLIALHYMELTNLNHRGTQSAIREAKRQDIPVKVLRFKPETAMPSSVDELAPGSPARKKAKLARQRAKRRRKA